MGHVLGTLKTRITAVIATVAMVGATLFAAAPAQAVSNTWYVDQAVVGGTGTSWASAFSNPNNAFAAAASGDTVLIAQGTYKPHASLRNVSFAIPSGVHVTGGYSTGGAFGPNNNVFPTILSGDLLGNDVGFTNTADNSYQVVTVDNTATARIRDLTITRGFANGVSPFDIGGGIYIATGSSGIEFRNVTLTQNFAATAGGGMHTGAPGGSYRFSQSVISGNLSTDGGGVSGQVTMVNSLMIENAATNDGGAIWGNAGFIGSTVAHNSATGNGGAIYVPASYISASGAFNSIFWGNTAATNIFYGGLQPAFVRNNIVEGGYTHPFANTNLDADPQFVNSGIDNYRLSATSPALAHGDNARAQVDFYDNDQDLDLAELVDDLDGNARIDGAKVDAGAYERVLCGQSSGFYVDAGAAAGGNGLSWASPDTELRDALSRAVSCANIANVYVATGTYTPDAGGDRAASLVIPKGVTVTGGYSPGGFNGPDNALYPTILSGDLLGDDSTGGSNAENSYSVVRIAYAHPAAPTGLAHVTVSGGNGDGTNPNFLGGGIRISAPRFDLDSVTVKGNSAWHGAGLYAIAVTGAVTSTITDSVFEDNTATTNGGGMYVSSGSGFQLLNIADTTVANNNSGSGGGMYVGPYSTIGILRSTITDNEATFDSGGIRLRGNDTVVKVVASTVAENTASGNGGGLGLDSSSAVELVNSLLSGNEATGDGGGLWISGSATTASLTNTTVSGSVSGGAGGALHSASNASLTTKNSVVWGNTPSATTATFVSGGIHTISNSDVEGSGGSGVGWNALYGTDGGGNLDADPLFVSAGAANFRLLSGSPALDVGANGDVPADEFDIDNDADLVEPTPDLDLGDRIENTTVDLGAYEGIAVAPPPDSLTVLPAPCAIYDSSAATGSGLMGAFVGNETRTVQVSGTLTGQGGDVSCVPTGASAVVYTISALSPAGIGNLRLSEAGVVPNGGVVNYQANGLDNANTVTVPLGASGQADIKANNSGAGVRLVALGYYSSAGTLAYHALTPCAVADSRTSQNPTGTFVGPFAVGAAYPDIDVAGTFSSDQGGNNTDCGVPASADAIVVNVVAIRPQGAAGFTDSGFLSTAASGLDPSEPTTPFADLALNNATATVIPLNGGETIAIDIEGNPTATSHVRVVALGYYSTVGDEYHPVNPCAAFDSRTTVAGDANIPTGLFAGKRTAGTAGTNLTGVTSYNVTVAIPAAQGGELDCAVPADATAVLINLVGIEPDAAGNFRAYASGTLPTGGVLNFAPLTAGMNNSNAIVVPLSAMGDMDLFINSPSNDGNPTIHARGVILGFYRTATSPPG